MKNRYNLSEFAVTKQMLPEAVVSMRVELFWQFAGS
jgi:hypothetical protein